MGDSIFIEPETCNVPQLVFLTLVYAVLLYQSSCLIAGGSELLQLIPSVAGIVGSIVLPILGAVPDGVMVLFSGLGPDAQSQVSVGVGALAGSTVMLLTFPWFICIVFGYVGMGDDGLAKYGSAATKPPFCKGCVSYSDSLNQGAKIMLATTALYLVIQIPASIQEMRTSDTLSQAKAENKFALGGLIACILAFCGYLVYCFKDANEDKQLAKVVDGIKKRKISIGAALRFVKSTGSDGLAESMLPHDEARLKKIVKPFFVLLDTDRSGYLDVSEFKALLHELGEKPTPKAIQMFQNQDANQDNKLSFDEVTKFMYTYLSEERLLARTRNDYVSRYMPTYGGEEEADEEEQMPEDLADLSPEKQIQRVLLRAIWQMGIGTFMVLIFSDPMVDVLSDWGRRLEVSPFYISFVLAPFASNASELLAAYTYAVKLSQKSMTTALQGLVGAACMNNTFCLAIFLALVYCKELAWQFTAETISIIAIQWIIGLLTILRRTQTVPMAFVILACYPGCLFLVWAIKNMFGLD